MLLPAKSTPTQPCGWSFGFGLQFCTYVHSGEFSTSASASADGVTTVVRDDLPPTGESSSCCGDDMLGVPDGWPAGYGLAMTILASTRLSPTYEYCGMLPVVQQQAHRILVGDAPVALSLFTAKNLRAAMTVISRGWTESENYASSIPKEVSRRPLRLVVNPNYIYSSHCTDQRQTDTATFHTCTPTPSTTLTN